MVHKFTLLSAGHQQDNNKNTMLRLANAVLLNFSAVLYWIMKLQQICQYVRHSSQHSLSRADDNLNIHTTLYVIFAHSKPHFSNSTQHIRD